MADDLLAALNRLNEFDPTSGEVHFLLGSLAAAAPEAMHRALDRLAEQRASSPTARGGLVAEAEYHTGQDDHNPEEQA